jgi:hypothetical protein
MTRPLLQFDVHRRTGSELVGFGIGEFLQHLDALTHRDAKDFADTYYEFPVVVLPHRKPNEKLERACARLRPRTASPDRAPTKSRSTIPLRSDRP